MGQGVDRTAIDCKKGIELVRGVYPLGLCIEAEFFRITFEVEVALIGDDLKLIEFFMGNHPVTHLLGINAGEGERDHCPKVLNFSKCYRFGGDQVLYDMTFPDFSLHGSK